MWEYSSVLSYRGRGGEGGVFKPPLLDFQPSVHKYKSWFYKTGTLQIDNSLLMLWTCC